MLFKGTSDDSFVKHQQQLQKWLGQFLNAVQSRLRPRPRGCVLGSPVAPGRT